MGKKRYGAGLARLVRHVGRANSCFGKAVSKVASMEDEETKEMHHRIVRHVKRGSIVGSDA